MFYKKYIFGDTAVIYAETPVVGHEGKTTVGLSVCSAQEEWENAGCDSLVQVAFTGDGTLVDYTSGVTMRNRTATLLKVEAQRAAENGIVTVLTDGAGNFYTHTLVYEPQTGVFESHVEYANRTGATRTLELLASVSLSGLFPHGSLTLHRMTSAWSRECRLKSESFEALGLEKSWADYGVKCERWGQVGSMPNRGFYPFAAIEGSHGCLGVTFEAPSSWQAEVYLERGGCALSGGQGDHEFAHWRKEIPQGGRFCTHKAFFTLKKDLLGVCNAFLRRADAALTVPASEEELPVLFNEYCSTWGCPSQENIEKILNAIKDFPIKTFVIDCGWYKPENAEWGNAVGDWQESKALFPHGIGRVVEKINAAGMQAGVWFECEVAARDSALFSREELLLKRDGVTLTRKNRRFLDLRKTEAKDYLRERLVKFLKEKGFSYLKIDYNDAYGIGCDGAESLGEGGRQVAEESLCLLDELKREIPDLVIENCASGGSRIEPLRMSKVSMCSFSDAHECAEIPVVAANVSRVVPARQIQIWAVLRKRDTVSRIVYSLCAAMIGRICLSGDVLSLTSGQRSAVKEGLEFYQEAKEIVRRGEIVTIDNTAQSLRELCGRQIYSKEYAGRRLIIVHFFTEGVEHFATEGYRLLSAYTNLKYETKNCLTVEGKPFTAGAFLLEKTGGDI